MQVNACHLPARMDVDEASIYRKLRELHCAQGRASHDCSGRLVIDRNGVTASCPLCGDCRQTYPVDTVPEPG